MPQTTRKFCALSFFTKKPEKTIFAGTDSCFFQHTKKKSQETGEKKKNGKKI